MINQDVDISIIKLKLPLEQLIQRLGVKVDRENDTYAYCICPFHDDKSPSFAVHKVKQYAKCYSATCSDLGTMGHIEFVQRHQHLPREMAIDFLFEMVGEARPIDSDHDLLKKVAEKLHQNVGMDKPANFFKARGITADVLDKMMVGYSPSVAWMRQAITDIPVDKASKLELLRPDLFDDTIVYTLFDAMGRVSGFKSRKFQGMPKYIGNSGEFKLRPARLYGMHNIKPNQRQIVLVEGPNDVLAMWSVGISNVVGLMGLNMRGIDSYLRDHGFIDVVLLADSDDAGYAAMMKSPDLIRVAQVPEGLDPDEYVHKYGLKILEIINEAKFPIQIKLDARLQKIPPSMTGKIMLVKQIAADLSEGMPPILLSVIEDKVAETLGIPKEDVSKIFSSVDLDTEDLEYKIVSHMAHSGALTEDIKTQLDPKMFSNPKLRKQATHLFQGLSSPDTVVKLDGLTIGDVGKFAEMCKRKQIKDSFARIAASASNMAESIDDIVAKGVAKLSDSFTEEIEVINAADLIRVGLFNIQERSKNPGHFPVTLGRNFPKANRILQGLRPHTMYVLAATQGTGKSNLAFEWALDMAMYQNIPVLWISLEMSRSEMADRAIAKLSEIDAYKISTGSLDDIESAKVESINVQHAQAPLYLADVGSMNIAQIIALTRKMKATKDIKALFIDYIQLIDGGGKEQSMYERVGHISRMIKSGIAMDRNIGIPVVAIAQLSKLAAKVDVPTAEHIAESYKISQDADVFMATRRRTEAEQAEDILKGQDLGNMILNIDKNRSGQSKVVIGMNFNVTTLKITEVLS